MESFKLCRICLIMDVKMHYIRNYPLCVYFEGITGVNPLNSTDMPQYTCYECTAMVKKYYFFKEKCLKGQATLYDVLLKSGKITKEDIIEVDRNNLNLSSNISTCNLEGNIIYAYVKAEASEIKEELENEMHNNMTHSDNKLLSIHQNEKRKTARKKGKKTKVIDQIEINDNEDLEITEEDIIEVDRNNLNLSSNISTCNMDGNIIYAYVKDEASEIKEKLINQTHNITLEMDSVKEEDDSLPFPPSIFSDSDDNEPLSIHQSEKRKTAKKKGKKTKVIDQIQINGIEDLEVPEDIVTQSLMKTRKKEHQKRKERKAKGSQRKNSNINPEEGDVDLEECVIIIRLTIEEQKEEIEKRKESSNYLNAQFQCDQCYKGFIDTNAWKNHLKKHDPSAGEAVCEVCRVRFRNKRALTKHAANHETKYQCKSCSFVSKTTTQAKQHQRWHKGVLYKCQYCDEISTKWTSHLSHVRIKHPSEFICGVCGYSFVSKLGLNMHKSMMHKDVDKSEEEKESTEGHYCKECDVKFVSQEAWKRHMVTSVKHSLNTDFKNGCRACGETFQSSEEVRLHHRREHAKKRPKNYGKKASILSWPTKCEHCNKMIANARELWGHYRRSHPDKNYPTERNYICDVCGKGFRGNAFLEYHKRTHGAERAFACPQCPKAFYTRTNLHMHLRSHSDHRPFPCALCCKAFKCRGALNRHFRCHTGDKPYVCEFCGKAFNQSNSHKVHVRTVHLKQPAPYVSRARLERRRTKDLPPPTYAREFQQ